MNKTAKKLLINAAQIAGLIVVALLVWYVAAVVSDNELIVPQPLEVAKLTFDLLGEGATWLSLLFTLLRSLAAFALSAVAAFCFALAAGLFPKTRFCVDMAVTFLRALPTVAVILLTLVVFRSSVAPVVVALLVAFPVAYSTFVRQFDNNAALFDVCKAYDVTAANRAKYFLLPLMRDELLSVAEEELPLCIKVVIAGEVLALPLGSVGREMYVAKVNLDTAKVVALTVTVLMVCFVISGVLGFVGRRVSDRA